MSALVELISPENLQALEKRFGVLTEEKATELAKGKRGAKSWDLNKKGEIEGSTQTARYFYTTILSLSEPHRQVGRFTRIYRGSLVDVVRIMLGPKGEKINYAATTDLSRQLGLWARRSGLIQPLVKGKNSEHNTARLFLVQVADPDAVTWDGIGKYHSTQIGYREQARIEAAEEHPEPIKVSYSLQALKRPEPNPTAVMAWVEKALVLMARLETENTRLVADNAKLADEIVKLVEQQSASEWEAVTEVIAKGVS